MFRLVNILFDYIKENFNFKLYAFFAVWLSIIFSINYTLNFEKSIVNQIPTYWSRVIGHFFFHFIPFIVPALFIALGKHTNALRTREFWFKVFVAFIFLAIYRALFFYKYFCSITPLESCTFQYKVVYRFVRLILFLMPLLIFYPFDKRHLTNFYGLDFKFNSLKLYFPLLLIMAVLVAFACFVSESIQNYYPLYLRSNAAAFASANNIPQWITLLIYESSYLFNFISIEFFFRGFFILAFVRLFGNQIVLPVVCLYATLHFGKPFLEAFGSIFGGYILSVLTLKTENIWGGILVHAGTAALMEFFAWLI